MKKVLLLRALMVTALIATVACSNPDGPTDDSGKGGGTTVNLQTFALTIDGTPFQPTSAIVTDAAASGSIPETLSILASDGGVGGGNAQTVTITVPASVGTYPIVSTAFVVVVLRRGMFALDAVWEASNAFGHGGGTVEITSRTSTTAEGRVNVTMAPVGVGAGSAGKMLSGTFSVRF